MIDPLRNGSLFDPAAHALLRTVENAQNPEITQRRATLRVVAVRLQEIDALLQSCLAESVGAQAYLRLIVPREALATEPEATPEIEIGPGMRQAEDLMHDVRMVTHLEGLHTALSRLQANNRRFALVVDLMLAATHLVESATQAMADSFLHMHIQQCEKQIGEVRQCLQDFPRFPVSFGAVSRVS